MLVSKSKGFIFCTVAFKDTSDSTLSHQDNFELNASNSMLTLALTWLHLACQQANI